MGLCCVLGGYKKAAVKGGNEAPARLHYSPKPLSAFNVASGTMEDLVKQLTTTVLTALILVLSLICSGQTTVSFSVLKDSRVPTKCSSPGWKIAPYDTSTVAGSYVHYHCRNSISHKQTLWLCGGQEMSEISSLADRIHIYNGNKSLKFGPVQADDHGMVIGCEVMTSYGPLPSRTGRITVMSAPKYSSPKDQVAHIGEPFDFDFNYAAMSPPSSYAWYKNGRPFKTDGKRVTTDHTGIIFTRILQEDAGEYMVKAYTPRVGVATQATSSLRVVSLAHGKHIQTGSSDTPILSMKLAVSLSLSKSHSDTSSHVKSDSSDFTSDSTKHALHLLMHSKRPTHYSHQQGKSRLKSESILHDIQKLTGKNKPILTDNDLKKIAEYTNCSVPRRRVNCYKHNILRYRTIDGTCNNFFYPLNGAAETPFARILPANYEDGISLPVGHAQQTSGDFFSPPWPSPRLVSWRIIADLNTSSPDDVSVMFMQWGQFLDHDLDLAPIFEDEECDCNYTKRCIPVEVKPEDTVFGAITSNGAKCLPFVRSVPACTGEGEKSLPRNQVNDLTSYIDASNVYGSDAKLARNLRLFKAGLLKQGGRLNTLKGNLPFTNDTPDNSVLPFFVAGDNRSNEQVGLTIMHTIWLREHNRVARQLMKINPCWDDERLYQETRKIIGAMHQVIVYEEFLPVLLGRYLSTYVPPYKGYNPFIDATIPNSFATAAYRFGHSLIRDRLDRLDKNFRRLGIGPLPLRRAFFNPIVYFESLGTDPILRGMLVNESNPTDEFLNRVLTSQLFAESDRNLGEDLATLNIQRGRDHGLPTYRTWEKFCKHLFPGITPQFKRQLTIQKLKDLYGSEGFKEGIDLWVGGLAERRLSGAQVGPTFACIFGITFTRLRDGDRFFYKNPYVFTPYQLNELKKTSLAKVICNNADDIPEIQRSVFRVGGKRVKCSTIPEVNLGKWWDRRCHYKYKHKYVG